MARLDSSLDAVTSVPTSRDGPAGTTRRQRRASASGEPPKPVSETIVDAAKTVEARVEQALLVLWDDLPHWRRDNAYILSGYRATSNSYLRSIQSLGYVHNESVNIWSHLLGSIVFGVGGIWLWSVVAERFPSANAADVTVFGCFFAGAFACLGMSATYHALANHSAEVAKWGNKLDYSGIVFLIVGSYVPALYYGFFCYPALLRLYLTAIVSLGVGCLTVSWFEHFRTPQWRPYRALMFVGLGVSGVIPVLHGLTREDYAAIDARMGLSWVLLQGLLYIFGAFLYAFRWPERASPGRFDNWGASHQIFHILILFAAVSHLTGMAKAFDYHHKIMNSSC